MLRIWNHSLLLAHIGCVVITDQRVDIPVDSVRCFLAFGGKVHLFIYYYRFFIINTIRFLTFNFGEM